MSFDSKGYELKYRTKDVNIQGRNPLYTYIYRFSSPITRNSYVVKAEYLDVDFFSVKFYPKDLRHSDRKYNLIVDKGDVRNIIITCAKVVDHLMRKKEFRFSSFGFMGSPKHWKDVIKEEGFSNTQRFKIYSGVAKLLVGHEAFSHFEYETQSCYLLVNNFRMGNVRLSSEEIELKELVIRGAVCETYPDLLVRVD